MLQSHRQPLARWIFGVLAQQTAVALQAPSPVRVRLSVLMDDPLNNLKAQRQALKNALKLATKVVPKRGKAIGVYFCCHVLSVVVLSCLVCSCLVLSVRSDISF